MQQIMQRIAFFAAVGLVFTAVLSVPAQALNTRSFVSAQTGSDSNNCTRASPCRTFVTAYANTVVGGEINTLDPGGYGPLIITHSISIVSGLGEAGVLVPSGGTGITINAGMNDTVNLRGLIIEGAGAGQIGIRFNTGGTLTIEKCVVRNVTNFGIGFFPTATSALAISDTLVANVAEDAVRIATAGGAVTATLSRVEADNAGGAGIAVLAASSTGTIEATVTDSVATGNNVGIAASSAGAPTNLMVVGSVAANNNFGIEVSGVATLRIGQSVVSGNANGWQALSGVVQSYGTNQINGNAANQTQIPAVAGGST